MIVTVIILSLRLETNLKSQEIFCPDARTDSNHYQSWKIFRDIINPNLAFLRSALMLDSNFNDFGGTLPNNGYYNDGGTPWMTPGIILHSKTDKEYRDREYLRKYMDIVYDTLKTFFKEEIDKKLNNFDCPNDFYLHFSGKRKLTRIGTNSVLYKSDEIQHYETCKNQLFKIFRSIKLPAIKPHTEFEIMFRYNRGWTEVSPQFYIRY